MWSLSVLRLVPRLCWVHWAVTLTNDGMKNKIVCLWLAWKCGFFTDGDDGDHTRRGTPFLVVNVKPSMMIWSMLVQRKGVEDQAATKEQSSR